MKNKINENEQLARMKSLMTYGLKTEGKDVQYSSVEYQKLAADGKVYAPCNATVDTMFETGHACSLVAENGAEILIHVGLETVGLGGKCFKVHVKNGQKVKKGQLMFEADLEGIKAAGLNTITPVLVCNVDDFASLNGHTGNAVTNDDVVIELSK